MFNFYEPHHIKVDLFELRRIILAIAVCLVVGFLLFYLVAFPVSPKTNLIILSIVFGVGFSLWRQIFFNIFASNFKKRIGVVGATPELEAFISEIQKNPHIGYTYIKTFSNFAEAIAQQETIDALVYGHELTGPEIELASRAVFEIINGREAFEQILHKIPVSTITDRVALEILEKKDSSIYASIRRIYECVFAVFVLVITLPFTLIAVSAVLIEDGFPLFYKQKRVGQKNVPFNIIKIRSMKKNAEEAGAQWAEKNDDRVTRTGRIIRTLHIDEIPQMFNILAGQIALVGPRAERPEFVSVLEKEIPYYFLRQTIKPGFTGWAQIKFRYARSVVDSQSKFEYDLYYLKNRNLTLDIGILIKTAQIVFTHIES